MSNKTLLNILKSKQFWVSYSLESASYLNDDYQIDLGNIDEDNETINTEFAFPMVCFCDIPEERWEGHIKSYGEYGIGLTKEWAKLKGISPVQYVENNSSVANIWKSLIHSIKNNDDIILLSSFLKPYKGKNGEIYYNEREWRYFPGDEQENHDELFLSKNEYELKKLQLNNRSDALKSHYELDFEVIDIACIIVPEKEKEAFEEELKKIGLNGIEIKTHIIEKH